MSTTAARPTTLESAHWYRTDTGEPCHFVPRADGSGARPTTLADARKLNLIPSVTTILKILNKPALNDWITENAVLACLTTPKLHAESLDEFVHRVLHVERIQDQESTKARDLGSDIHAGLEAMFRGERIDDELRPWIEPAYNAIQKPKSVWEVEKVLVGRGYAGRCDLIQELPDEVWHIDWKSTKKLPKEAWPEHRLQLAAYTVTKSRDKRPMRTANVYISTQDCGKFIICEHAEIGTAYHAFMQLVSFWQWQNNYRPIQYYR